LQDGSSESNCETPRRRKDAGEKEKKNAGREGLNELYWELPVKELSSSVRKKKTRLTNN